MSDGQTLDGKTPIFKSPRHRYRWHLPYEWLMEKLQGWSDDKVREEFQRLAAEVDAADLEMLYFSEMTDDGYWDDERNKV